MSSPRSNKTSFACREVMAPAGLWERGAEASGYIPPSARLFQSFDAEQGLSQGGSKSRAPKALAISPSGETTLSARRGALNPYSPAKGAPLDTIARKVTPPSKETQERRGIKYRLRATAAKILMFERVAKCGCQPILGHVDIRIQEGNAFYAGIETCGSIWVCPVCAPKIAETRRLEVEQAISTHNASGGDAWMATLTIPHHKFQSARELRLAVAKTWRKVIAGSPWSRAKKRSGIIGMIRALEVTHGGNGWHPHLHVVLLLSGQAREWEAERLGEFIYLRWARFIEKDGFGECSKQAFSFKKAYSTKEVGDYLTKHGAGEEVARKAWGVDAELTKPAFKTGKSNGSRTPWQILQDAANGCKQSCALFREYGEAFKGAQQLTWTAGLKALYCVEDNSDEAISDMTATHPNTVRRIYRKFSPDYLEDVATSLAKTISFTNQFAKPVISKTK